MYMRRKSFKRILSCAAAVTLTTGAVGSGLRYKVATADYDSGWSTYSSDNYSYYDNGTYDAGQGYSSYDTGYSGYDTGYSSYDNGYSDYNSGYTTGYDQSTDTTDYSGYSYESDYNSWYTGDVNDNGDYIFEVPPDDTQPDQLGQEGTGDNGDTQDDDSSQSDDSSEAEDLGDPDDINTPLIGSDIGEYANKLKDLARQQSLIQMQIEAAKKGIETEKTNQTEIQKKIDAVTAEINEMNASMTALEIEIGANKRELAEAENDITEGVEGLKKRLRALYLAGTDSYTTVILESDSFYDVLMRMELIKRVAEHDDKMIDDLYKLQAQLDEKQEQLDAKQAAYDEQYKTLEAKKAELDELYHSTEETLKLLEIKQKAFEKADEAFDLKKAQYESDLSSVLKTPGGTTSRDEQVAATMELADAKLDELHKWIRQREKNGEEIGEDEPSYTFGWPAPGAYNITSGVGARWGSYHQGMDIMGNHGMDIVASDAGTVIRTNESCTHDYGKTASCGCGGGYGNYVIIDHGNDFITLYGHLTEVDVEVGQKVKQGEVIGKMGSTGFSTGDHVHFEIRYQGYIVNPAYYVNVEISEVSSSRSKLDKIKDRIS